MSEWKEACMDDCFVQCNDKAKQIKSTGYNAVGHMPIIDQSDKFICGFTDESNKRFTGKLPVTIFGDHTRHVKFVDFDFVAGADGTQILKPKEFLTDKFFYYAVCDASQKIGNYGYDRHLKHLKNFVVEYPVDKAEQLKIAEILCTVDDEIERTEALIAKYEMIKQGMMQDLFTRGVSADGKLRPRYEDAPELYKDSPMGMIPKEWEINELEEITSQIIDGTHHTPCYTEMGVPFLRVTDIQSKLINFDKIKYISENEHRQLIKRCNPQKGDILLSKNGTIGITKIVDWDWEFSVFVSLSLIKPIQSIASSEFLALLLGSEYIWEQIRRRAKQGTVTNLHLEEIREFLMILPKMPEQEAIVERLGNINEVIDSEKMSKNLLLEQKQGLMQDLLSGEVRVAV